MALYKKEKNQILNHLKDIIINNNDIKHNQIKNNKIKINEIYNIDNINYNNIVLKKANTINNVKDDNKEKNLLKEKDKKIEDLKELCEILQKQLQIKTDYINKEKEKFQNNTDDNNKNNRNINYNLNTSTNFPIKSEIKKIWEEFALMSILDNFIDYENKPELIFFFVTEMIVILQDLINDICKDIYEKVSISLNNPNDKKFLYDIEKTSRPLIKEHLNKIFINTEQKPFINKFIELYKNSINLKFQDIDIEQIINSNDFFLMIKKIKDILLFTKFNDPPLLFNIEKNIKERNCEKIFINNEISKKNYLIINDNGLKHVNCVIILKCPVMTNGFPISNDLKTIIMMEESNPIDINLSNKKQSQNIKNNNINMNQKNNIYKKNEKNIISEENKYMNSSVRNTEINRINININYNKKEIKDNIKEYNNKKFDILNRENKENDIVFKTKSNSNNFIDILMTKKENKTEENIKITKLKNNYNLNDNNNNNINTQNDIISNFSFISENLNIKNDINENSDKSMEQKLLSSDSREIIKSATNVRNFNDDDNMKNSFTKYKENKNEKKIKKIKIIKNSKIKININKINNNIKYSKYNIHSKKSPKENLINFYNKKLPLLLKNNIKEKNRLKSNNFEKMKIKKKTNNKFDNFSTEIYSKEIFLNNDLMIKNKTVKELFNINHKKNKDFLKIRNKQNKINNIKQSIQLKEYKFNKKDIKCYNKIKNNLKYNNNSKIKACKTKEINKIKNNDIKSILKCILNNNIKNEFNKNLLLINRPNNTKIKENFNLYKMGNIKKNIKSISGKNILLSPKDIKNKKIYSQRNYNNTYMLQNNNDKKNQNEYSTKNSNISYPNLHRSIKFANHTGYKIKNLNINYFNIIQPHELFFNQHSSRSNSKPQMITKNKFIIVNNNNSNTNTNYNSDLKIRNILSQKKNKNKIEKKTSKTKNSLYLITDYNYNVKSKYNNKKFSEYNIHQHNGSYTGSSFGTNKFEGSSSLYLNKDKKSKKLIKQKICYNNDLNSINLIELNNKKNLNNLIKNSNCNTQISFIKISKKLNYIKRDVSTGRKYISKKIK